MSQFNTDLEANLVTERQRLNLTSPSDDTYPDNPSSEQFGSSSEPETIGITESSLLFNLSAFLVPIPKIFAALIVLATSEYACTGVKQYWIMCMIAHDLLHTYIINLRIRNIVGRARLETFSQQGPEQSQRNNLDQGIQLTAMQQQQEGIDLPQTNTLADVEDLRLLSQAKQSEQITKRRAKITSLSALCIYLWMFLFLFWLQTDDMKDLTECDSTEVLNLVTAYIIIGWIWLLHPMLICMTGCVLIPVIIIFVCFFRKTQQQSASKKELKKLKVKPYKSDLPGNKECAICIADYQEGDKIVQLECSTMHHFHEDCAKSWLKINGQCPICRTRLGEKNSANTTASEHEVTHEL